MAVVLLVHCDGSSGSTTFTDASASAHPLTPTSVTVATGNPKFGTGSASLTFSNLAASISVGSNASDFWFDSGPFTMEAWCYATQAPGWDGYSLLFAEWGAALSNLGFWFSVFPTIMFFWSFDGVNYGYVDAGVGCPLNAWTHIAADRDASGTLRVYLNGAVVASSSIPGSLFHSTFTCQIGNDNTLGRPFPGYLDEIRVTKGTAVYGGAFTPPTAPFLPADPISVTGALFVVQANQTISAAGGPRVGGTLSANQAGQTLVAAGGPRVGGTLNSSQAANTLSGAGTIVSPGITGTLSVVQAVNTLTGAGTVVAAGSQYGIGSYGRDLYSQATPAGWVSFSGQMSPQVNLGGSLTVFLSLQGDLPSGVTLAAQMTSGPLWSEEVCPPADWETSESCPPSMWTPVPPPLWVAPSGWKKQEKVDDVSVWGHAAE